MLKAPVLKRRNLPPIGSLEDEKYLTPFASGIRSIYSNFFDELLVYHRSGPGGLDVSKAYSYSVESIVKHIYSAILNLVGNRAKDVPAVVATGGFGRYELSPRSDVDIVFLWRRRPGKTGAGMVGYMVRLMWDSGLKLSHAVHTVESLRVAMKRDSNLETAMLDSRWLCGDEELKKEISLIKSFIRGEDGGRILQAKLIETQNRWKKYGNSYHIIEPNVKESPGGLRDFQTIRWIGMVLPWSGTVEGLYRLSMADRAEIDEIKRAFDFLLRTRNELHFIMKTAWDVLSFDIQAEVARGLGYRGNDSFEALEVFMKDYYSRTRAIYQLLLRFLDETSDSGSLRIIDGELYRKVGTEGINQLNLNIRSDKFREDPLYPFKEQLVAGKRFSPSTERRIKKLFRARITPSMLDRMKESFIEFLSMEGKKADVLKNMHELGVMKLLFPAFEKLTCLKKHEVYHQYTADEHSFQSVRHLEALEDRKSGFLPRLYQEVDEKLELTLATLLHDIGKIGKGPHSVYGARLAKGLLKGFPLSSRSVALITFLIRNHLVLSHFSQQRDIESPETIAELAKLAGDRLRLKLLYLLTYADLKATGPSIWTGWKSDLLKRLYMRVNEFLEIGQIAEDFYREKAEKAQRKVLASVRSKRLKEEVRKHLSMLPLRYVFSVPPESIVEHVRMIEEIDGKKAVAEFRRRRNFIELTICTKDMPARLSQLCGVISISDFNILSANAFTRKDGYVIDIFNVVSFDGSLSITDEMQTKFVEYLCRVLNGEVDLLSEYRSHLKKWKRRFRRYSPQCTVEFENELSADSTIVDITAGDRPGLLFDITRALSSAGLDILIARVTTRGNIAADSFYVRKTTGGKVDDTDSMKRLREKICSALEVG